MAKINIMSQEKYEQQLANILLFLITIKLFIS